MNGESPTSKENRIFIIVVVISLVLIIFLLTLFFREKNKESGAIPAGSHPDYTAPSNYPILPGEKYTPPFP
ncbi:MAG: hypothetical protein PHE52_00870 [Candidatus Pacebacteria bacterium]|nr:hypothetical protein [Candidatus Paceibacterota bacterium]